MSITPPLGIRRALPDSIAADTLDPSPAFLAPRLQRNIELARGLIAFQRLGTGNRLGDRPNVFRRRVAVKRHVRLDASART